MELFELYTRDRATLIHYVNADNVNVKLRDGTTLLHVCAQLNDFQTAKLLLENGIKISTDWKDETAADVASRNDSYKVLKLIMEFGYTKSVCATIAMENNSSECLRIILERKLSTIRRINCLIPEGLKRSVIEDYSRMCRDGFISGSRRSLEVAIELFKIFIPEYMKAILTLAIPLESIHYLKNRNDILRMFIRNGASFLDTYTPYSDTDDQSNYLFRFAFGRILKTLYRDESRDDKLKEFWLMGCFATYRELTQDDLFVEYVKSGFTTIPGHDFIDIWLIAMYTATKTFNVYVTELLIALFAALVDACTGEFSYVRLLANLLTDDCVAYCGFTKRASNPRRVTEIRKKRILRIIRILYMAGFRECDFCADDTLIGELTYTQHTNNVIHEITLFELTHFHIEVSEKANTIKNYI
jgi:hypothetical protein